MLSEDGFPSEMISESLRIGFVHPGTSEGAATPEHGGGRGCLDEAPGRRACQHLPRQRRRANPPTSAKNKPGKVRFAAYLGIWVILLATWLETHV